jgi:predicted nucleic acid-binding Zn ribbon protein
MEILKTCEICGSGYLTGNGKAKYCSDACRKIAARARHDKWLEANPDYLKDYRQKYPDKFKQNSEYARERSRRMRGSKEYTRECIVCGKVFTTWLPHKKTCSDVCKKAYGIERDKGRKRDSTQKRTPEEKHKRYIVRKYGSEDNYQKWLAEQEALKLELEQRREQERQARKEAYENQIEVRRIAREARKEANHRIGTCVVCGNSFDTYNPAQKTCSKECGKRLKHAHKHKRIPKKQLVDKDITLEALYKRDSGVCYLCGKLCDWNDKDGNVVGSNYPSIDHMIPISRGGLHAWTNVKLAHFECNWKKSDDLPPSFSSTG